jgi:glyoxylase-like metal-dependent hydrolase (beta-lactamase superfamily II)
MSNLYFIPFFMLATVLSLSAQEIAGIHKVRVGATEVTAVLDGEVKLAPELLQGIKAADVQAMLGSREKVRTPVNAFLVHTGKHLVLVDAGGAATAAYGNTLGHVAERLQKAGVNLDSIEAVLITHLHFDHVGGLVTPDGQRAFPKAQIRLAQAEYDYWMDPALEAKASEQRKAMLKTVKAALAPYQAAGALRPFAPGEEPFPGVTALPIPGHTPGHTAYIFGKGKSAVWMIGDTVHFAQIQFQRPEVSVSFDTDSAQAISSRLALFRRAAKEGAVLADAHIAFPGMGHAVAKGSGFEWVPVK